MTKGTKGPGFGKDKRPSGGGPGTNAGQAGGTGPGRPGTGGDHGGSGGDSGTRGKGPKS